MSKTKIITIAHLPPELMRPWLQHLRDFDTEHPGCHFEILATAPEGRTVEQMQADLQVDPPFALRGVVRKQ